MPAFANVQYVLVDDEQVWPRDGGVKHTNQQKLEKIW